MNSSTARQTSAAADSYEDVVDRLMEVHAVGSFESMVLEGDRSGWTRRPSAWERLFCANQPYGPPATSG